MMKALLALLTLCFALAIVPACEDDPVKSGGPPPPPAFMNLTERWHVLNNIEMAYSKRNISKYDELLDDDFTFFLSAGDAGGSLPDSWDRETEVQAHTNLFSIDQPPAPLQRVLRIHLDVAWEGDEGNPALTWMPVTAPNTETWYRATVSYHFQFDVEGDYTYISNPGSTVQFTVRNAGTNDAPQWRLVEMRDLGTDGLVASSATKTEQSTWGNVKARYR